ncbi:hypothetical protein GCK32_019268, partial [Trichostrongylus colubriformis]
ESIPVYSMQFLLYWLRWCYHSIRKNRWLSVRLVSL